MTTATAMAIPRKGQPAPDFRVFSLTGQPLSITGLKGSVVILDFWATWCPPCRESIPFLAGLYRKYGKQGLQIVGMNVDEGSERSLKAFVQEKRIPYQIVSAGNRIQDAYGIRALPVLFLIDKRGIVQEQFMGFSDNAGQLIEALVKKQLATP